MMKVRNIIYLMILSVVAGCNDVDNYDAPNATFKGVIVNSGGVLVGQPVEGVTGLRFNVYDNNVQYVVPQQFYAKSDGTFQCSSFFAGSYNFMVYNANFYPIERQSVVLNVGSNDDFRLMVTPFCAVVDASVEHVAGTEVCVRFKLLRERGDGCKIVAYGVYGGVSPKVDDMISNHISSTRFVVNEPDALLVNSGREFVVNLNLADNKEFESKYEHIVRSNSSIMYVRMAVFTEYNDPLSHDSPQVHANFSTVMPIKVKL